MNNVKYAASEPRERVRFRLQEYMARVKNLIDAFTTVDGRPFTEDEVAIARAAHAWELRQIQRQAAVSFMFGDVEGMEDAAHDLKNLFQVMESLTK